MWRTYITAALFFALSAYNIWTLPERDNEKASTVVSRTAPKVTQTLNGHGTLDNPYTTDDWTSVWFLPGVSPQDVHATPSGTVAISRRKSITVLKFKQQCPPTMVETPKYRISSSRTSCVGEMSAMDKIPSTLFNVSSCGMPCGEDNDRGVCKTLENCWDKVRLYFLTRYFLDDSILNLRG